MPRGNGRIRKRRNELGWSQLQLAIAAGVSQRTVTFAEAGESSLTSAKLSQIAQTLGMTCEEASKKEESREEDRFGALPWSASKWIQEWTQPEPEAFCVDALDVKEVLSVMRENWHLHLERGDAQEHFDGETFCDADEKLNQSYFHYEQRYLSLWKRCPSVLMLATSNGLRTGASIVLPVTDSAYERLRDGEISFMEIGADDLCDESQNLVLDHCVEFSNKPNQSWYRLTDRLSYTIFCQIALLAIDPNAESFRMISFGASPINIRRLAGVGFHEYGVRMPEYGYSMCEFSVDAGRQDDDAYSAASTWTHFAHLAKRLSPSIPKQRVVRRILKALQIAIKGGQSSSAPDISSVA